jgi:hypothetical protein
MPKASTAAGHGEKMIEVKVRFFTNALSGSKKRVRPRHGWIRGTVKLDTNAAHRIVGSKAIVFNSLMELPYAIEKLLIRDGITLHLCPRMDKYLSKTR